MSKLASPFRVGLFIIVLGGVFVAIYSYVHKGGLSKKEAVTVTAIFHDASGLTQKSEVTIAGINVGEVTDISLAHGNLARVTLRIKRSVELKTDAALSKVSASLLGDYQLELYAGSDDAPLMPDGGEIQNVNDRTGMQEIFANLTKVTKDIEKVTDALGGTLNNEQGSIAAIVQSLKNTVDQAGKTINETLDNVHVISEQMGGVVTNEQDNVKAIVDNVKVATGEAAAALKIVDQVLGANKGDVKEDVESVKDALRKLNESLQNVKEVTDRINNGQGTVGKLMSDDSVYNKLDDTLTDASDFIARLLKIQTEFSLKVDYLAVEASAKGYLQLKLTTRPDRYYLFQAVEDTRASTTQTFSTCSPCSPLQATQETTSSSVNLKWSAEVAQRWSIATLRLGLIESTAGGGVDVDLWGKNLMATADLFDFADTYMPYPRLRAYLTGRIWNHIELRAGVDDIFNKWATSNVVASQARGASLGGRDIFFGGGIFFTDEDLKAVLGVAPIPK